MATKAFKNEKMEMLKEKISKAKVAIVTENKGLSVDQITDLRRQLQKENGDYTVIKNTLAKLVIEGTEFEGISDMLQGPIVLALGYEDQVAPAKVIAKFIKTNENVVIKGGVVDGSVMDEKEVNELAKLPSKEELYAKILGSVNSPASGIVMSMNAVMSGLVRAMDQVAKQKTA